MGMNGSTSFQKRNKLMKIIEKITKNELPNNPNEIQKICLDKLKLNPLPDTKSEFWRLSNKS